MKKSISLRVAIIASAVAVYSIYMHVQQLISGCMWVRGHQRCSFENSTNFEGWMDLDLMITCCWVAAAVVGWISVAQGTKKRVSSATHVLVKRVRHGHSIGSSLSIRDNAHSRPGRDGARDASEPDMNA